MKLESVRHRSVYFKRAQEAFVSNEDTQMDSPYNTYENRGRSDRADSVTGYKIYTSGVVSRTDELPLFHGGA